MHPVAHPPLRLALRPRGELVEAALPLGEAIGGKQAGVECDDHLLALEVDGRLGAEALGQQPAGQGPGRPGDRQLDRYRWPRDGSSGGIGQPAHQIAQVDLARARERNPNLLGRLGFEMPPAQSPGRR